MNVKRITLAVASLALMSNASAYAAGISANVGPVGAGVGVGPLGVGAGVNVGTVLSYPATYTAMSAVIPNTCGTAAGLNGERIGNPWLDLGLWKFGFKAGVVNPRWDMRPVGMF